MKSLISPFRWRALGLMIIGPTLSPASMSAEDAGKKNVDFVRDIQPIFKVHCYKCHGPDKRKGRLRFDSKAAAMKGGKDGPDIIPGNAEKSPLYRRLTTKDKEELMPQKDGGDPEPLAAAKIKLMKDWIDQGAVWPDSAADASKHWSYVAVKRPPVPQAGDHKPARNPIDHFIFARLDQEKLEPSREAEKTTLIRRLTFDITGLPPPPEAVDAFLADTSSDAYEKLVDRLLASPHYGERMAVYWLDVVRYADSMGYHGDNPMNVSPYRDYVIAAFNGNKPFDQFATEQLAGDLIPNATTSQKVASAYNRLLQTTPEGGAQPKEYEYIYACDRVRNTSEAFLGSTMGCCQCHNHKYDPFTLRDFYGFAAFFADVQEAAVGVREEGMPLLDPARERELKQRDAEVVAAKKKLDAPLPALAAAQAKWEKQMSAPAEWKTLVPQDVGSTRGTALVQEPDGVVRAGGNFPAKETYKITAKTDLKGITAFRLELLPDLSLPAKGVGTAENGNFVLTEFTVKAETAGASRTVKLAVATATHSQDDFPIANAIDGKNDTGWAILPKVAEPHAAVFETKTPVADDGEKRLTFTLEFQSQYAQHQISRFRLAVTASANPSRGQTLPANIRAILAAPQRTVEQKTELAAYYRGIAPLLAPLREELGAAEKRRTELVSRAPKCLVSISGAPRTVRIHARGNWLDESGDVMKPAVPSFLGKLDTPNPTRLDLAKWIVGRDNPLTARVAVNRLWRLYFGAGISKSVFDFGAQGAPPTHPELLDWLAAEFIESGWDVKHIVKLIVTSHTYRRTSVPTTEQKERDPLNRLLARQTAFRIDAEFIRDNALAISGLLVDKIGGPSVFPYQPAGYWTALNFPTREWPTSKKEDLYRRGLYTHWQRTFLHPSLYAFDACTREESTAERPRSNIPQQALVLLNDPTYVEAARVFAARILKEGGATAGARLDWAFRRAVARPIKPGEADVLTELSQKHLSEFRKDPDAAKKVVAIGEAPLPPDVDGAELAAWTGVARTILNLHETITRE